MSVPSNSRVAARWLCAAFPTCLGKHLTENIVDEMVARYQKLLDPTVYRISGYVPWSSTERRLNVFLAPTGSGGVQAAMFKMNCHTPVEIELVGELSDQFKKDVLSLFKEDEKRANHLIAEDVDNFKKLETQQEENGVLLASLYSIMERLGKSRASNAKSVVQEVTQLRGVLFDFRRQNYGQPFPVSLQQKAHGLIVANKR